MCIRARQLNNTDRYLLQHQMVKFQPLRQSRPERRFPPSHPEVLEDVILEVHCQTGLCSSACRSCGAVCTPLLHLLLCARLVLLWKAAAAWVPHGGWQQAGMRSVPGTCQACADCWSLPCLMLQCVKVTYIVLLNYI